MPPHYTLEFTQGQLSFQVVQERDDLFFSDDEENDPKPRLPLFGRCPLTNRAFLDHTPPSRKPLKSATNSPYSPAKMSSPYSPAKMSSPYSPYSLYSPSKAFSPSKGSNNYSPYYREDRLTSPELDLFGRSRLLMDVNSRMPLLQVRPKQTAILTGKPLEIILPRSQATCQAMIRRGE